MNQEPLNIKAQISRTFSYLEYHTDGIIKATNGNNQSTRFSLIREIIIENPTLKDYDNVILSLTFDHSIFQFDEIALGRIEAGSKEKMEGGFNLHIDSDRLYHQVGIDTCQIQLTLSDQLTGEVLASLTHNIQIFPINQIAFSKKLYPFLMAKYVMPDLPEVNSLVLSALKYQDNRPFIGYQNTDANAIVEEVRSLYQAVHDTGIVYSNPLSLIEKFQRIRLPNDTINEHRGTCLDTSILFASLIENIGLHPILILIDNHAYVGVFLEENDFFDCVEPNRSNVYNKASKGIQSLLLFETTSACAGGNASFQKAIDFAYENIKNYRGKSFYAVDISSCHQSYFKPIPFAADDGTLDLDIKPLAIKDDKLEEILNEDFIDIERLEEKDRFTTWERKLLDLSEGNKLVSYNQKNTIRLIMKDGKSLYDFLKKNDDLSFSMTLLAEEISEGIDADLTSLKDRSNQLMNSDNTVIGLGQESLAKKLIRSSQEAMEETGAATLYLTLGLLSYLGQNGRKQAPFLLLPIAMTKSRFGKNYTISLDLDNLMINQTFFEYYKVLTGIDYSQFYSIRVSDEYSDIVSTFKSKEGGELSLDENVASISNFTFAHYVMWKDIRERKEELKKNPVIQSLLENRSIIHNEEEEEKTANEKDDMAHFAAPLSYDSTQLDAILACGKGHSFILDGPPGTGKSQTIVNMIVNAMYQGKTVLFVAEKMAALSVVKERLDKLGLGRFTLELYSNKANKSSVFSQLNNSMQLGRIKDTAEFKKDCEAIEEEKDKLAKEIQLLHKKENRKYSLYEALELHSAQKDYEKRYVLPLDYALDYTEEKDERVRSLLSELTLISQDFKNFNHNVYPFFHLTQFNYFDKDKFLSSTMNLDMELASLYSKSDALLKTLGINESLNRRQYEVLIEILNRILNDGIASECLVRPDLFETHKRDKESLETLCHLYDIGKSLDRFDLSSVRSSTSLEKDIELLALPVFFLTRIKNKSLAKKDLSSYLKAGNKISGVSRTKLFSLALDLKEYKDTYQSLEKITDSLNQFFHEPVLEHPEKGLEYLRIYESTYQTYHRIQELNLTTLDTTGALLLFSRLTNNPNQLLSLRLDYSAFKSAFATFLQHEQELSSSYQYDYALIGQSDFFRESKEVLDYVSDADNINEILALVRLNQIGEKLKSEGLSSLYSELTLHHLTIEELLPVFESALADCFIRFYFQNEEVNGFSSLTIDNALTHYRELIGEYNTAVITSTAYKVTSRFIDNTIDYQDSTPIGALKKLVSKGGRGITIRNALIKYADYFRTFFPCFMMSPLSAAQYLSVDSKKFDVVIFDEASQIPTSEAIGPIARGKALIVSGDPKQMPPTNFFSMNTNMEGDNALDETLSDAESLLDDCLSIDMPRIRLSYHYRSKHESLISFSNQNFYDSTLYTFPSPDARNKKLTFDLIQLKEEKKNTGISKEEIDAIIGKLDGIVRNPEWKNKSIGIIVFNQAQQDKLKDVLEDYLDQNKGMREELEKRSLFIKSLENVQGDERDIILLSVGFRKNASGKASIQGPITLDKGERRLNVAITRAKECMMVLSTIQSSDINAENSLHRGPKFLKSFLAYAQGNSSLSYGPTDFDLDSLLKDIQKQLKIRGYESSLSLGSSQFRIPLAVKDKEKDSYSLALFLDNEPMQSTISHRDRFYVQRNMLSSLGWKTLDIYALDYFRYEKKTIDRIIEALAEDKEDKKEEILVPVFEKDNTRFDYQIQTYIPYQPQIQLNDSTLVEKGVFYPVIAKEIKNCINTEAPISYDLLKGRMKKFIGIERFSPRMDEILRFHLNRLCLPTTLEGDKTFYWQEGNTAHKAKGFRSSDRHIEDIPKEEILVLMQRILTAQGSMTRDDFIRATARLMNLQVVNETVRSKLNSAIDFGIGSDLLPQGVILP